MFFVRNKIVLDSSQNDFPDSNFIRLVLLGMFKNLIHTLENDTVQMPLPRSSCWSIQDESLKNIW